MKPKIKIHSGYPPAISKLNGVTYVVPTYQAVPHGTTLRDLEWIPLRPQVTSQNVKEYKVKSYIIRVYDNGQKVTCTCPGFTYRKQCKHSQEYKR